MTQLDPSYLRYIFDGLLDGSIEGENSADLPLGLSGIYEETFRADIPVAERQAILEQFTIWALFKKELDKV